MRWLLSLPLVGLVLSLLNLVEAAAPAPEPPITSPAEAWTRAWLDAKLVPPNLICCTRYLWVSRPTERFRIVEKLRENLLSRCSEIVDIVQVEPWLWRVRLDEPGWDPGTWEAAADNDIFFHFPTVLARDTTFIKVWPGGHWKKDGKYYRKQIHSENVRAGETVVLAAPWLPQTFFFKGKKISNPDGKPANPVVELREMTYSESPILNAEWLFAQSVRQRNLLNRDDSGVGYYDWLQLKDRNDYFNLIDPSSDFLKASDQFGREFLAALDTSGISEQNRQILRRLARGGGAWNTLDTKTQKGRGVALNNLKKDRGQEDRSEVFDHDTEEWIAPLPNRLPAYFLSTDKGVRQNVAPGDDHNLHNKSSLNRRTGATLHVGLGCLECHSPNILIPFTDAVRKRYKKGGWLELATTDPHRDRDNKKLLLSDIYKPLARDEEDFADAVARATIVPGRPLGLDVKTATVWFSAQFHEYATDSVSFAKAARELGVKPAVFLVALRNYAKQAGKSFLIQNALAGYLLDPPEPLSRLTWEDSYPLGQEILAQQRAREAKKD